MNIEIGKTYSNFDDGKIRATRQYPVTITGIYCKQEMTVQELDQWRDEVKTCPWLYYNVMGYFVKGDLEISEDTIEEVIYVKTKDGRWFSLGYWAGLLDVDGSLTEEIKK